MTARLSYPTIEEYSNIIMATLLNINISRLLVTALANDKKIKLNKSIFVVSLPPLSYSFFPFNTPIPEQPLHIHMGQSDLKEDYSQNKELVY
jgi:hypothetical protein